MKIRLNRTALLFLCVAFTMGAAHVDFDPIKEGGDRDTDVVGTKETTGTVLARKRLFENLMQKVLPTKGTQTSSLNPPSPTQPRAITDKPTLTPEQIARAKAGAGKVLAGASRVITTAPGRTVTTLTAQDISDKASMVHDLATDSTLTASEGIRVAQRFLEEYKNLPKTVQNASMQKSLTALKTALESLITAVVAKIPSKGEDLPDSEIQSLEKLVKTATAEGLKKSVLEQLNAVVIRLSGAQKDIAVFKDAVLAEYTTFGYGKDSNQYKVLERSFAVLKKISSWKTIQTREQVIQKYLNFLRVFKTQQTAFTTSPLKTSGGTDLLKTAEKQIDTILSNFLNRGRTFNDFKEVVDILVSHVTRMEEIRTAFTGHEALTLQLAAVTLLGSDDATALTELDNFVLKKMVQIFTETPVEKSISLCLEYLQFETAALKNATLLQEIDALNGQLGVERTGVVVRNAAKLQQLLLQVVEDSSSVNLKRILGDQQVSTEALETELARLTKIQKNTLVVPVGSSTHLQAVSVQPVPAVTASRSLFVRGLLEFADIVSGRSFTKTLQGLKFKIVTPETTNEVSEDQFVQNFKVLTKTFSPDNVEALKALIQQTTSNSSYNFSQDEIDQIKQNRSELIDLVADLQALQSELAEKNIILKNDGVPYNGKIADFLTTAQGLLKQVDMVFSDATLEESAQRLQTLVAHITTLTILELVTFDTTIASFLKQVELYKKATGTKNKEYSELITQATNARIAVSGRLYDFSKKNILEKALLIKQSLQKIQEEFVANQKSLQISRARNFQGESRFQLSLAELADSEVERQRYITQLEAEQQALLAQINEPALRSYLKDKVLIQALGKPDGKEVANAVDASLKILTQLFPSGAPKK